MPAEAGQQSLRRSGLSAPKPISKERLKAMVGSPNAVEPVEAGYHIPVNRCALIPLIGRGD